MAGDLGNEAAGAVVSTIPKTAEITMQIIEKIFAMHREKSRKQIDKITLNNLLTEKEKIEQIKKIDGMQGCIEFEKLKKYAEAKGTYCTSTGVRFSDSESIQRFAELAKRNGIKWTSVTIDSNELGGCTTHIFSLPQDLEQIKRITKIVDDECRVRSLDSKIVELKLKGIDENSTFIQEIKKAKYEIVSYYTGQFNSEVYSEVIDKVLQNEMIDKNITVDNIRNDNNMKAQVIKREDTDIDDTLSKALNRDTGRTFDHGRTIIIADASEPERYVVATSEQDTFHEKKYTKSTYEVHNPNGNVTTYNDARFEGRPLNYWPKTKKKMLKDGEFREDATLLKFDNENEFLKWKERTNRENIAENTKRTFEGDFKNKIRENEVALNKLGYEIRNGDLYSTRYDKKVDDLFKEAKIERKDGPNRLSTLNMVEAVSIYNQTQELQKLVKVDEEYSVAKAGALLQNGNKEEVERLASERQQLIERVGIMEANRRTLNGLENQAREDIRREARVNGLPEELIDWDEVTFQKDDQKYPVEDNQFDIHDMQVKEADTGDRIADYEKLISNERKTEGIGNAFKEVSKETSKVTEHVSR